MAGGNGHAQQTPQAAAATLPVPAALRPPADRRGERPDHAALNPSGGTAHGATPPVVVPIRSDAHALATLDDAPYLAYAAIQGFKLFAALVAKRWPVLRF